MEKCALLVYAKEDIEKNRWFIDRLTSLFKERGVDLLLKTPEDHSTAADPLFVINRSRDPYVSAYYEERGIRSFNNSETVRIGNDKLSEYGLFKKLGLPVMETVCGNTPSERIPFSFPVIVKERAGHGGSGVFRAEDPEELSRILEGKEPSRYMIQEMCDEPGIDVRLYILGGQVVAAVKRTSENDFRSNFSLGGSAEATEPCEEMISAARAVCKALKPDYIGLDLIRNKGGWVANEIEDAAGARMLYSQTDIDIALLYVCHICEKSSQNAENGIE
ncbi:MAG: ATP-grasp domain-containing protein [Lachnospiraceae bacterium]|nr:ATP-grasp domain-containing protein [Lachnospiraceae bacterium]